MQIPRDLIKKQVQEAMENSREPEEDKAPLFCPISLGDWLDLCRKAEVPYVPAELIINMEREDCLTFDTPGEHQDRLRAARRAIEEAHRTSYMARLDCCASIEVKVNLAHGDWQWKPEYGQIILDDPRAFDIIMEYPRTTLPVWQRPWVEALVHEQYPVEYRAFVRDNSIAGISSYYPQRPLIEFEGHIEQVREYTQKLIDNVEAPFLWPLLYMPDHLDQNDVHFTADFIATNEGILLIEGGPPHDIGAHPCCFQPGRISGIALSDRNPERVY